MTQSPAIKVLKKDAEKIRAFLLNNDFFATGFKVKRNKDFVYFPVNENFIKRIKDNSIKNFELLEEDFEELKKSSGNLRDILSNDLTKEELESLVKSFDLLGNVAIIEIPKKLRKKQKLIAKALMLANPSVKSVFKKVGAHKGVFRVEPVKLIAGKKTKYAFYKESGCNFRISIGKVFFSPRLSYERIRIAKQIKDNEIVACLFAGVGPFPIVFAKNSKVNYIYAVELNKIAFEDMVYNVLVNRVENKVFPIFGDVKEICPKFLKGKCDRVVMPLPKGAEHFLKEAMISLKSSGGIIHFYSFVDRNSPYDKPILKIETVARSLQKEVKILFKREVRDYSPEIVQIVIDVFVSDKNIS